MFMDVYRRVLYAVGVPFTASQIGLWLYRGMPDLAIGAVDQVVQVALIVLLVDLFRAEASPGDARSRRFAFQPQTPRYGPSRVPSSR